MIFPAIQAAILSLLFIAIIHTIYIFLKDNLTTPKIKDLVNKPTEQYGEIYKSMKNTKSNEKDMKAELQNYFAELTGKNPKTNQKEKAAAQNNGDTNNSSVNNSSVNNSSVNNSSVNNSSANNSSANNSSANNSSANKTNSVPITDFSFHSNTSSLQYQSL
jgi:hypothetical protein